MMWSEPCACCVVAPLICLTISCSRSTARVTVSLPLACSRVAPAISFPMLDAFDADSRMLFSALPASCESDTPFSTSVEPADIAFSALLDFFLHGADEVRDVARRRRGALGQLADLRGDDGEALAVLARLRREDRGVEREEVRLLGDVFDDVEDLADGDGALAEARRRRRSTR